MTRTPPRFHWKTRLAVLLICATWLVVGILVYVAFPIRYVATGRLEDWIGNDHGFALKIDGEFYWLSYGGDFESSVPFGSEMVGKLCQIEYFGTMLFPRGSGAPPSYATLVSFTVWGSGGGKA